jgi:chitin disaccharide deacetylase
MKKIKQTYFFVSRKKNYTRSIAEGGLYMRNGFTYNHNQIIITADDFGYDGVVNQAIYQSLQRGLIHSTSMIANMEGFDDAVKMFQSNPPVFKNTGIHFNLTEGYPLVDSIKSCPQFCDESGKFFYKRQKPLLYLSKQEKTALREELTAQMEKLLGAGIHPGHMDSHHHIHTEWPVLKLVVSLAKEYHIQKIRLARNMGTQRSYFKMKYKSFLNHYLKYYTGRANSDLFGDLDDFREVLKKNAPKGKYIEIMVHPSMNLHQDMIVENGNNLQDLLLAVFPDLNTNA